MENKPYGTHQPPQADIIVDIDMLGSAYDTKIDVYREDLTLVACNDDFHPDDVSRIDQLSLAGSVKYFLVIDGYGGDAGDYLIEIRWPYEQPVATEVHNWSSIKSLFR